VTAGGGSVALVFNDRSRDPRNKLIEVTLAGSQSGSRRRSQVISKFASNFDDAFFGRGSFAGDYLNVAMDEEGWAHAVWTCVAPGKKDSDICMESRAT
jgi:hypothetical protein